MEMMVLQNVTVFRPDLPFTVVPSVSLSPSDLQFLIRELPMNVLPGWVETHIKYPVSL